jgi:hypothetical protein
MQTDLARKIKAQVIKPIEVYISAADRVNATQRNIPQCSMSAASSASDDASDRRLSLRRGDVADERHAFAGGPKVAGAGQPAHGCQSGFTLAPEHRAGTQLEYKIVGRCPGRLVKAGAGPPHAATMALGACLTAAALGP